jgi:hypothetical protein
VKDLKVSIWAILWCTIPPSGGIGYVISEMGKSVIIKRICYFGYCDFSPEHRFPMHDVIHFSPRQIFK